MNRKVIAVCGQCGKPYAGFYNDEGELLVKGKPTCEACGGTDLREITATESSVESAGQTPIEDGGVTCEVPSLDQRLDVLGHETRRRVLVTLAVTDPSETVEFDPEDLYTGKNGTDREQFLLSLHHAHLPKLDGADYVEWERGSATLARGPRFEEIEPLLRTLVEHEANYADRMKPP